MSSGDGAWPWPPRSAEPVHGCSFGDERFLALIAEGGWDLLCHHAADVTNYKSPDFDAIAALGNNTHNLPGVLEALKAAGCRRLLLSGSVFEGGEGAGSQGLPDFSPYGLSKALTAQVFRYYCARAGIGLGKFVIPNPFGPYEEPRFTSLSHQELAGRRHAELLQPRLRPGQYPRVAAGQGLRPVRAGSPGRWLRPDQSQRLRREPGRLHAPPGPGDATPRLGLPCPVELKKQVDFPEPRVRINTDPPDADALGWDESAAWDEMADYYRRSHTAPSSP